TLGTSLIGCSFSLLPVFVQHGAAQLYLKIWNLIKDQRTDVHLEDALHCFFQPREFSSKSKCFCENCRKKTHGKQVLKLTHLPQTLTIHLMPFPIRNSQPGGQYELFTVITHVGMVDSSHYCAYIRNAVDGKWFCFNDSNIASVRIIIHSCLLPGIGHL
uniref:ubl carboxyl-terminal hydrolase 18 n=1 Tax=Callithrix jacchus TaxID=9483 RepID=UPI0023DD074B